jgi:uncharacterized membrane protein YdbT with pleckstrin-like domain
VENMHKYIENNLTKNEKVIIEAKFNFLTFIPLIIIFVICLIIYIVVSKLIDTYSNLFDDLLATMLKIVLILYLALLVLLALFRTPIGSRMAITNKRVIGKRGILSLSAVDYPINKIDQICITASFFGKIFHYSTLLIKGTSDSGSRGLRFYGISNAVEVKNCINDALDKYAEEARKAQAEEIARAMHPQN